MSLYVWIALGCAAIPTFLYMIFAPVELQRYTLCVFAILATFVVAMLGIVAGGAARSDPE